MPLPEGLPFMVPECDMQASKEGQQPIVLPSYDVYEPQQPECHGNPKGAVVACIPWW